MKKIILCGILFTAMTFLLNSCGIFGKKEPAWKPVKPENQSLVHTVKWQKETLPLIAKWYTGSNQNSIAIADANPAVNHDRLIVGDTIYIPKELLKTRKPLPETFLFKPKKVVPKKHKKKKPAKPAPPKKEEGDFELFGPK